MNTVIIGYGQIGRAVHEVTGGTPHIVDSNVPPEDISAYQQIDIMHVCFPFSEKFVEQLQGYIEQFKPEHIIIYSTVPIGVTRLFDKAVHSPIEGRHPQLAESIKRMTRWIGTIDLEQNHFFLKYFVGLGLKVRTVGDSNFTEFLKLRSTSRYGVNLVFADYEAKVAHELEMGFSLIEEFDTDYNRLYEELGVDWAKRYILQAPKGKIGGHCVVPNAEILDEQFPNDMLKMIKDMK